MARGILVPQLGIEPILPAARSAYWASREFPDVPFSYVCIICKLPQVYSDKYIYMCVYVYTYIYMYVCMYMPHYRISEAGSESPGCVSLLSCTGLYSTWHGVIA